MQEVQSYFNQEKYLGLSPKKDGQMLQEVGDGCSVDQNNIAYISLYTLGWIVFLILTGLTF